MPKGCKPEGEHPLSNAQRQARYRARSAISQTPTTTTRAPWRVRSRPRPRRWREAVAELLALQAEYAAWLITLPDALQETATAQALQAIVDLDLDTLAEIDPPLGYGRD